MNNKIINSFAKLGFAPRDNQVDTVSRIITALQSGKRYVFLDAPTGSGKSVLAMVVRDVLDTRAVIVTATNSLVEQYGRDFPEVPMIIGADNYACPLRKRLFNTESTAKDCYKKSRFFYTQFPDKESPPPECVTSCEFSKSRTKKHESVTITNYSYYILDQLYIKLIPDSHGTLPNPTAYNVDVGIFDEAHLINEQFAAHYSIHYTKRRGQEFLSDIRKLTQSEDSNMEAAYTGVFNIIDENIARGSIGLANVDKFLSMLMKFYNKMMEIIETKKMFEKIESGYDGLTALYGKYHGLSCKIDDYFKFKPEVVVDVKKGECSLTVQPIFIGKTSQGFCQKQNLFMSATMNYEFMVKTMELDPADCELVKVDYVFNTDDKTIDMTRMSDVKINYSNMNSPEVVSTFVRHLEEIYALHPDQNGVVITTSFLMAEQLSIAKSDTHEIILHSKDTPAKEIIRMFKSSNKPTILVSPSLFEGVDLPGVESQFQVIPKAPYLSLGAKRMYYISRKHRGVYLQMSIMRMIQACGRSTRHIGDKSMTYLLDKNCGTLFRSRHNTWKEQFHVIKNEIVKVAKVKIKKEKAVDNRLICDIIN